MQFDQSTPHAVRPTNHDRAHVHAPTDTQPPDILCADQVAAWFGVDRKTVYTAAAQNKIPHQRLGKRVLFSRHALVSWLACERAGSRRTEA